MNGSVHKGVDDVQCSCRASGDIQLLVEEFKGHQSLGRAEVVQAADSQAIRDHPVLAQGAPGLRRHQRVVRGCRGCAGARLRRAQAPGQPDLPPDGHEARQEVGGQRRQRGQQAAAGAAQHARRQRHRGSSHDGQQQVRLPGPALA